MARDFKMIYVKLQRMINYKIYSLEIVTHVYL